ncbi:uncharacterized protein CDV56_108145 [Aspergillus thermomutatus]|uniref:Aromatic prenyltransferase (DMATS family) n=1 Tax=Aspergillus thermomutatus TaxID=41047 RepID=A0A397HV80_ASPTH|nr:uncharacterized protein CDV56_108145 [Aspergillus thermomutatus]RHZ67149.1 hypothetical protein CDV56_108145 [Aspergillus thermomutatus]
MESDLLPLRVLSKSFNFTSADEAKWWHSTAPMFAALLAGAKYDLNAQYRFLVLHREFVIPTLGPYPTKGKDTDNTKRWHSTLTRFGLPFELSFNYSKSLVRFAFEPLGPLTGTAADPFNTKAIRPTLQRLAAVVPRLDLEWFDHFRQELVVSDEDVAILNDQKTTIPVFRTQNKLAADLAANGDILLKTYIYPRIKAMATGVPKEKLMFDAIRKVDRDGCLEPAVATLEAFMAAHSSSLIAHFLSCDLVKPCEWRIKLYCFETQLGFESMAAIWTLDGRRTDEETMVGLELLRELWGLIPVTEGRCALPDCFHELGTSPEEQLPFIINFTLSPGKPLPEPQIYFPVFGKNDRVVAEGLATFFNRVGWKGSAENYVNDLASYYPDGSLEEMNHIQAWISFASKNKNPSMSVYLHTFEAMKTMLQDDGAILSFKN